MEQNQKPNFRPGSAVLSVVVPIFNEADSLTSVLNELVPYCRARKWKLILVNDGSNDGTPSILNNFAD